VQREKPQILTGDLSDLLQWLATDTQAHADRFEADREHSRNHLRSDVVPAIEANRHGTIEQTLAVEQRWHATVKAYSRFTNMGGSGPTYLRRA